MIFPPILYLLALAVAFATSALAVPAWRKWCLRAGLVDDPGGRKIHRESIPLAGGLGITTALLAPALLAVLLLWWRNPAFSEQAAQPGSEPHSFLLSHFAFLDPHTIRLLVHGLNRRALELTAILVGAAGMLLLGLFDDKYELRPATKFSGQLLVALLVAGAGARITLFVPNPIFSYAITILWILTVTNAFNFMDNMNGLCAGLGIIGAFYFGTISALAGQYLVALIAFLACGALLGFLPYNFPRARVFLGDSGSHLTGYLLAVLAILPHFYTPKHPRILAVLSPLLILAVPLGDLVRVVLFRWRNGRPFYLGDTNHLSHRLVQFGLSPAWTVMLIWLLAALLGALALVLR